MNFDTLPNPTITISLLFKPKLIDVISISTFAKCLEVYFKDHM